MSPTREEDELDYDRERRKAEPRLARLAAAMRVNLRRRKDQQRARAFEGDADPPLPVEPPETIT